MTVFNFCGVFNFPYILLLNVVSANFFAEDCGPGTESRIHFVSCHLATLRHMTSKLHSVRHSGTKTFCGSFRGWGWIIRRKEQLLLSTQRGRKREHWKFMAGRNASGIRAASAGRFPDSTWRAGTPSLYHEKCAPQKERVKSAPPRTYAQREYAKCDVVRNDEIWKNRCKNEGKMTRKW